MAELPLEIGEHSPNYRCRHAPNRGENGDGKEITLSEHEKLRTIFEPCTKCFERYPNILDCLQFKYGEGEEYEQEEISKLCDSCRNRVVVFPPSLHKKFEARIDPTTGKSQSVAKQLAHLRDIGSLSIEQLIQSIAYFENEGLRADVWRELSQDDQVKFINTMFPRGSFNRV